MALLFHLCQSLLPWLWERMKHVPVCSSPAYSSYSSHVSRSSQCLCKAFSRPGRNSQVLAPALCLGCCECPSATEAAPGPCAMACMHTAQSAPLHIPSSHLSIQRVCTRWQSRRKELTRSSCSQKGSPLPTSSGQDMSESIPKRL